MVLVQVKEVFPVIFVQAIAPAEVTNLQGWQ